MFTFYIYGCYTVIMLWLIMLPNQDYMNWYIEQIHHAAETASIDPTEVSNDNVLVAIDFFINLALSWLGVFCIITSINNYYNGNDNGNRSV